MDFRGFKSINLKTNEFETKKIKEQGFITHNHHVYEP